MRQVKCSLIIKLNDQMVFRAICSETKNICKTDDKRMHVHYKNQQFVKSHYIFFKYSLFFAAQMKSINHTNLLF
jgi:hypothetical protein